MSNIPREVPVFAAYRPPTTTLVLVPMSVHSPPRMTAAFIGMSSLETGKRCFRAQSRIAGTIRATTGVLFMNAEATPGAIIVRNWAAESDCGRPRARSTSVARAPVRSSEAASTNRPATVIMPSLLMPLRASSGVITPPASSATTPAIITMSGDRCTNSRRPRTAMTTAAVRAAGQAATSDSSISAGMRAGLRMAGGPVRRRRTILVPAPGTQGQNGVRRVPAGRRPRCTGRFRAGCYPLWADRSCFVSVGRAG